MTPLPKRPRPFGRLPQCSKVLRLQRRRLGQWTPQPVSVRNIPVTRYTLENDAWKEGL